MAKRDSQFTARLKASPAWLQNRLLLGITALYFAWVLAVAAWGGFLETFDPSIYWTVTLRTIFFTALFMGFVKLLHIVLFIRPKLPLTMRWEKLKAYFSDRDWMINVALAVIAIPVVASLYTSFKTMIPALQPFYLDEAFMTIDRALHFGTDPWRLTHALFGGETATVFINFVYHLWFFFLWGFLLYNVFFNRNLKERMSYIVAFAATWMVLGSIAALILSSAGPVYYAGVTGLESPFAPLMEGLREMDAHLRATSEFSRIWALSVQDRLWDVYSNSRVGVGSGISAMPSMHIATTALMTFHAFHLNRWLGWFMTAVLVIILIGSVHLGWHYAIDGYVAIPLAWLLWRISRRLTARLF